MSGFLSPIRAEDLSDGYCRKLLEDIVYHVGDKDSLDKITIPAGFVTDGGSVPRPLWGIVSPWGKASKPYILHDWLYHTQQRSRLVSDAILMEAMEVVGVNWFQRKLIHSGVRIGGWVAWNGHTKENKKRRLHEESSAGDVNANSNVECVKGEGGGGAGTA